MCKGGRGPEAQVLLNPRPSVPAGAGLGWAGPHGPPGVGVVLFQGLVEGTSRDTAEAHGPPLLEYWVY